MPRLRSTCVLLLLLGASMAASASNCDTIRAEVEAKLRAGGLKAFTVDVVEAGASAPGKLVGSCAQGTRKLVYRAAAGNPSTPQAAVLTECRDGRVLVNGDCRK